MANHLIELEPNETDLCGDWIVQGRNVVADAAEERIKWLIEQKLQRVTEDCSGWQTLYRDPGDGRLWELTFPQSQMHGGGPRRLHTISKDDAAAKYPNAPI